jgi:uncharacterized membrane protein (DUF106 family)
MEILYALVILAVCYAILSVVIQRKVGNMKRVRELQAGMKEKMNEYKAKIKNNAATDELAVIQKDLGAISSEMMKHQLKPMLALFPLLILVYYYLLPNYFPTTGNAVQILSFSLSYRITFIIVAAVLGIALSSSLMLYDKRKYGKKTDLSNTHSTNA